MRRPPRGPYRRPALALDLDQAAHGILELLLRVISPPRPSVEVIHAYDIPYQGMIYPSLSEDDAGDADLLVLGTHGHSGVAHAFLGTVAGDVLREVACDVRVVPPRRDTSETT